MDRVASELTDVGAGVVAGVVEVFVGQPAVIGSVRDHPIESAIAKARVGEPELLLRPTNLDGDRQADLTVHGGPDKAVYVYPRVRYPEWRSEGFSVAPGGLGENVSLDGLDEDGVRLGDVWRWGGALVQISQPRAPCYKLAMHTGRKDIGPRMLATGRSGWYLRVLEPGTVPTAGTMELVDRSDGAPTVRETFGVMFDEAYASDADVLARVLSSPALAESWREPLSARRG
jgi:MOSC domain-containing protein YiiM